MIRLFLAAAIGLLTAFDVSAQGASWRLLRSLTSFTVQVNHDDPSHIMFGNRRGRVYISHDGGKSFARNDIQTEVVNNSVSSLLWSTADTTIVIAGGFRLDGIHRSTDGGRTWARVLSDNANQIIWFISEAIIESTEDPSVLYAARGTVVNTIYKSTNTGLTWDSVGIIDRALTSRLCTITMRPESNGELFVGALGGRIFRSTDDGVSWQSMSVIEEGRDTIRPDSEIPKIVFRRDQPNVGYAVVAISNDLAREGNGGVLRTIDGGLTWYRMAYADTSLWAVETRQRMDTTDVFIGGFRMSFQDPSLPGDSIVAVSKDNGITWTSISDSLNWGISDDASSVANSWVLRWDTIGKKLYLAAETGLFVYDEVLTSVREGQPWGHASLSVITRDGFLDVRDSMRPASVHWTVHDMKGAQFVTGVADASHDVSLPLSPLTNGVYLLTWETESLIRSALFTVR